MHEKLGACQWFHFQDRHALMNTIAHLRALGVTHLRTGISWTEYARPGGKRWYDAQMGALKAAGFRLLIAVSYTPPWISEGNACNTPPRRLEDFAEFVQEVLDAYGDGIDALELWNEPNSRYEWDPRYDPGFRKFSAMILPAIRIAKRRGVTTVLGGIAQGDIAFLNAIPQVVEEIDIIGIHGFPRMWPPHTNRWELPERWESWTGRIEEVRAAAGKDIWITETGLATYDRLGSCRHDLQCEMLLAASQAPCDRVYWYSVVDLDPARIAIEEANGDKRDEAEYHLGLVTCAGERKPAYALVKRLLEKKKIRAGISVKR